MIALYSSATGVRPTALPPAPPPAAAAASQACRSTCAMSLTQLPDELLISVFEQLSLKER